MKQKLGVGRGALRDLVPRPPRRLPVGFQPVRPRFPTAWSFAQSASYAYRAALFSSTLVGAKQEQAGLNPETFEEEFRRLSVSGTIGNVDSVLAHGRMEVKTLFCARLAMKADPFDPGLARITCFRADGGIEAEFAMRHHSWRSAARPLRLRNGGTRPGPYRILALFDRPKSESSGTGNVLRAWIRPVVWVILNDGSSVELPKDSEIEGVALAAILKALPWDHWPLYVLKPTAAESIEFLDAILSRHGAGGPIAAKLKELRVIMSEHKSRPDLLVVVPGAGIVVIEILGMRDDDYASRSLAKLRRLQPLDGCLLTVVKVDCRGSVSARELAVTQGIARMNRLLCRCLQAHGSASTC